MNVAGKCHWSTIDLSASLDLYVLEMLVNCLIGHGGSSRGQPQLTWAGKTLASINNQSCHARSNALCLNGHTFSINLAKTNISTASSTYCMFRDLKLSIHTCISTCMALSHCHNHKSSNYVVTFSIGEPRGLEWWPFNRTNQNWSVVRQDPNPGGNASKSAFLHGDQ